MTIGEFAERCAELGMLFGLSATSWGRSLGHNDAVGGVPGSAHLVWRAADLKPLEDHVVERVITMGMRLGLLVIPEGDHYHVQPQGWPKG